MLVNNEILIQRQNLANKIKKDIEYLYDTIKNINFDRFNKTSKFKWKKIYNGYTDRVSIFAKKNIFNKKILIYDIEDSSCYLKLVKEQNEEIFEVIEEAVKWIQGETDLIQKSIKEYSNKYFESSKNIKMIVDSYMSLQRN